MIFGFNTDVRVGKQVFHVQTEDRGPSNPVIDTTIYTGGRVVHRCANSYKDLLASSEFNEAIMRQLLEKQHRYIIDGLRDGTLRIEVLAAPDPRARRDGIQVQLLNPATWLAAGTGTLKVEVKSSRTFEPVPGVRIRISLQGIAGPVVLSALTDAQGRTEIIFPLPRMAPGGTELVIHASGGGAEDEIRYLLRPKAKATAR